MKTNKILSSILMLVVAVTMTSCVQDDDYSVPNSFGDEENAALANLLATATEVDMAYVKGLYNSDPNNDGNNADAIPFLVQNDIYVKGYVSSSDQTGNFFKEFYIQDSPSSPTSALKIVIEQIDTYNQFNFGREVYISLKGLYIGEERTGNGIFTIGGGTEFDQYGGTVTRVNQNQIGTSILRSQVTEAVEPLVVTFSQLSNAHVGLYVQVNDVEFANNLNGLRYFDPVQVFDTQRALQACSGFGYSVLQLETSSFSTFKEQLLPTGNGSIKAVVNKTFDGSSIVLALNTTADVNMTDARCAPLSMDDFVVIFEEDFESAINNTNLDFPGWTNFNEAGNFRWREKTFDGNGYTEFSSYNSGNPSNIGWLVTPSFDMDAQESVFLNFKTAQHHLESPDNTFEVFVSTDYDGTNVLAATWEPISAALATQSNEWYEFVDSGLIDLSSYSGTLYVAFKVTGNSTTLAGGFQIDDLILLASE